MAIAFDSAVAGAGPGSSGTNLSVSVTAPSGSNTFMLAAFRVGRATEPASSATYNGVAMTRIAVVETDTGSTSWVELYYLAAPASGANTLARSGAGSITIHSYAVSFYTGVRQTAQPEAFDTEFDGTGGDLTISVTSNSDNCWLVGAAFEAQGANAGTTSRANHNGLHIADKNAPTSPAGAASLSFDEQFGNDICSVAAMLAPAVPIKGGTMTLMGV